MATVQESIEVDVPLSQAYNQWTQFEDFPHFMSGVDSVTQLDDATVHFKTSIGGVKREYDARISVQEPDRRVTWESLDEPRNAGTVWFEPIDVTRTKVSVELSWEPDTAAEKVGAAVGLDSRQVASDLKKFKTFIEERGTETGAWRGRVDDGAAVGTETGIGTGTGAGTGVGTGMGTGTGAETGMGTRTGAETGMGTRTGAETGIGTGTGAGTGMGTGTGPGTGMGTGTGAVSADARTAVPLEEEADYGAAPNLGRVDTDPDMAKESPLKQDPER